MRCCSISDFLNSNCSEISTTIDNHYHTPISAKTDYYSGTVDFDTFDHILTVTSEHEAVYAYYYMDENNKVRNRNLIKNSTNISQQPPNSQK